MNGYFVADLHFAARFGIGVARDFPAVLAFLNRDHAVVHFEDRSGDLIILAGGQRRTAEREAAAANKLNAVVVFIVPD